MVDFETYRVKSVRIRDYSRLYYPGINAERYFVSLRIQSKCGKIRIRITPNTDTFCAVLNWCTFNLNFMLV